MQEPLGHYTVTYVRTGSVWQLQKPFTWHLRERASGDRLSTPFAQAQAAFYRHYQWLSTASQAGAPVRVFRIRLGGTRDWLGVVFIDTATMRVTYWPASMGFGCRNLPLVKGDAPARLEFDPSSWSRLED